MASLEIDPALLKKNIIAAEKQLERLSKQAKQQGVRPQDLTAALSGEAAPITKSVIAMLAKAGPDAGKSIDKAIKVSSIVEIYMIFRHRQVVPSSFVIRQLDDLRYIYHAKIYVIFPGYSPVEGEMWFDFTDAYDKFVALFGQRAISAPYRGRTHCATCGAANTKKGLPQCKKCKQMVYCDRTCQVVHWKSGHKKTCEKPDRKEWKNATEQEVKDKVKELEAQADSTLDEARDKLAAELNSRHPIQVREYETREFKLDDTNDLGRDPDPIKVMKWRGEDVSEFVANTETRDKFAEAVDKLRTDINETVDKEVQRLASQEMLALHSKPSSDEDRITVLWDTKSDFKVSEHAGLSMQGTYTLKPIYKTFTRSEFEDLKKQGKISATNDFDDMLRRQRAYVATLSESTADDTASTPLPSEAEPGDPSESQAPSAP